MKKSFQFIDSFETVMYGKDIVSKSSNDIGIISNAESNSKSAEFVSVIIPIFPSGKVTLYGSSNGLQYLLHQYSLQILSYSFLHYAICLFLLIFYILGTYVPNF